MVVDGSEKATACDSLTWYVHPRWTFCSATLTLPFFEIIMHSFQRGDWPQLWPGTWRLAVAIAAWGLFRRAGHGSRADKAARSSFVLDVNLF